MENAKRKITKDELLKYPVLFRLGALYGSPFSGPTVKQFVLELSREFSRQLESTEEPPEKFCVHLENKYSHRLLKTTLIKIGYRTTSAKPDCSKFYVRKIK